MATPLVITRPHYITGSECGYCHGGKPDRSLALRCPPPRACRHQKCTHVTIGCEALQMTCQQYDEFINMGFRRSGSFIYKGDMLRGCCRMYTIRTKLSGLKISKEHRQVVNRFKRAILNDSKNGTNVAPGGSDPKTDVRNSVAVEDGAKRMPNTRRETREKFSLASLIEAEQESSRFHTRYESSAFSEEKFALYKKYQVRVHDDKPGDITRAQFKRFLCESPFPDHEKEGTEDEWDVLNHWVQNWRPQTNQGQSAKHVRRRAARLGPTHECYYLDDKLIAISVLDFLPTGLSSIYFIWDPDHAKLSLGTLSGIRELQMCHELGLGYYYLGYYIEDCEKMRYKGKFGGELLDVCCESYVQLKVARAFMTDDSFWTTREANDLGVQTASSQIQCSLPQPQGETPISLLGSPGICTGELRNIAEDVYGQEATYETAAEAKSQLQKQFGISFMDLPLVLPGAMPLKQVLYMLQEEEMYGRLRVRLLDSSMGPRSLRFSELSSELKGHMVDFMRLFGIYRLSEAVILN